MTAQPSLFPLLRPDVPGYVHGIVSVDPPMVQCDGCGYIAEGDGSRRKALNLLIQTCGIEFDFPSDGRRLCRDCAAEAGWKE